MRRQPMSKSLKRRLLLVIGAMQLVAIVAVVGIVAAVRQWPDRGSEGSGDPGSHVVIKVHRAEQAAEGDKPAAVQAATLPPGPALGAGEAKIDVGQALAPPADKQAMTATVAAKPGHATTATATRGARADEEGTPPLDREVATEPDKAAADDNGESPDVAVAPPDPLAGLPEGQRKELKQRLERMKQLVAALAKRELWYAQLLACDYYASEDREGYFKASIAEWRAVALAKIAAADPLPNETPRDKREVEAMSLFSEALLAMKAGDVFRAAERLGRLYSRGWDTTFLHDEAEQQKLAEPLGKKVIQQFGATVAMLKRTCVETAERQVDFQVHMCDACKGTGKLPCMICKGAKQFEDPCPLCHGKGKVVCEECRGRGTVDCLRCGGIGTRVDRTRTGRGYMNINGQLLPRPAVVRCNKCKGRGYIKCRACRGRGTKKCPRCKGTGTIVTPCDACQGTGERQCRRCKGKGRLP